MYATNCVLNVPKEENEKPLKKKEDILYIASTVGVSERVGCLGTCAF